MKDVKVSAIQMNIIPAKPDLNRTTAKLLIEKAVKDNPDIIILPEMWTTAYELKDIKDICDLDGKPTLEIMKDMALNYNVNIITGSFPNEVGDKIYNAAYVLNRKGEIVGQYNKIHLFKLMNEDKYISPGDELCTFYIDDIKCGIIICYDLRFPELTRKLALSGINVLFVPAQWPSERIEHWLTLLRARAIENNIFVVAVNRAGESTTDIFNGNSMIISPSGEVLNRCDHKQQIISSTIELDAISKLKEKINVYIDRRPELY